MATVLHIDGPHVKQPIQHFVIESGESFREVADRLGVKLSVEQVPDQPKTRELAAAAEAFLAGYEYEESGSVLAVFWRYHSLDAEEFDTVEEARQFLENGAEYGSLAGEAIVDGDRIEVLP